MTKYIYNTNKKIVNIISTPNKSITIGFLISRVGLLLSSLILYFEINSAYYILSLGVARAEILL
jgi:hypothetical protein